jgi:non-ribosomal peptide synthetase component F
MPQILCDSKILSVSAPVLVHHLIERQAFSHSAKTAVTYKDKKLSYEELNQESNYVANYLIAAGIKPEAVVAVSIEYSLEMIIAVLGVLKAGGAYLPIDPAYPQERIDYMLSDSNASVLLTQTMSLKKFKQADHKIICLDSIKSDHGSISNENPQVIINQANLAYIGFNRNPKRSYGLPWQFS